MARPNLSYLRNLSLFLFGLPCGLFTGLTAIGTSVPLMSPLRYLLGLRGARASGTALAVILFAALTSLLSFGQHGDIRWGVAFLLTVGQFLGEVGGQRLVERVPVLARLGILWAVLVGAVGLGMSANAFGLAHLGIAGHEWSLLPMLPKGGAGYWGLAFLIAVGVGLVSRVVGVGRVLIVPAAIYLLGMPPHVAEGTALLVLLLASLPGTLIHARRGDIESQAATWMSVGGVFGALCGAFYATTILSPRLLLLVFGVALTLIGLSLLWRPDPPAPVNEEAASTE